MRCSRSRRPTPAAGGGPLRFNFAGSNVLARQIANGAPADVFISADLVQMQYAEKSGAIAPGASSYLLNNSLAVVTLAARSPRFALRATWRSPA